MDLRGRPGLGDRLSVDPAGFSVFATGPDALVAAAADQIAFRLSTGKTHGLAGGELDDLGVRTWHTAAVGVDLYFTATKTVDFPDKTIEIPCVLQLAVERRDAPSDGQPSDHERSRRTAGEGSALQRWYLAAQEDLPDDVVEALALDEDPAVVAALHAGATPGLEKCPVAGPCARRTGDPVAHDRRAVDGSWSATD